MPRSGLRDLQVRVFYAKERKPALWMLQEDAAIWMAGLSNFEVLTKKEIFPGISRKPIDKQVVMRYTAA